jgi:hypothetical protein
MHLITCDNVQKAALAYARKFANSVSAYDTRTRHLEGRNEVEEPRSGLTGACVVGSWWPCHLQEGPPASGRPPTNGRRERDSSPITSLTTHLKERLQNHGYDTL